MSRAQEGAVVNTAKDQNTGYYSNAQNSYTNAQTDAGKFENQLGTYAAANPYNPGGQYQTATNQVLSDTADANAQATGTLLQGQALRTGENSAGDVAATEAAQQSNERAVAGQQATATQSRIAAGADYNKNVLAATAEPVQQQTTLSGQQAQAAGGALGTQEKAGETPSWTDEFGNMVVSGLGQGWGAFSKAYGGALGQQAGGGGGGGGSKG